jgi:hypothetical protein
MCDHRVVLHRCVVREWYNPSGSAVITCLNAAARTLRAARAVQGDVLTVWQALYGTPSAPLISAHRVTRFDDHLALNLLINNKLCQRYSRFTGSRNKFPRYDRSALFACEGRVRLLTPLALRPHVQLAPDVLLRPCGATSHRKDGRPWRDIKTRPAAHAGFVNGWRQQAALKRVAQRADRVPMWRRGRAARSRTVRPVRRLPHG